MIKRFIIYGLLGWCLEVFWTGFGSLLLHNDINLNGHTSIWMFFIYGAAVLLEPIYNKIKNLPVILRGGIYTILIFSGEYLSGTILRFCIGSCPWNYGKNPLAINGLIQLDFIPVWFTVGLLFEKLYNFIMEYSRSNDKLFTHKMLKEKLYNPAKFVIRLPKSVVFKNLNRIQQISNLNPNVKVEVKHAGKGYSDVIIDGETINNDEMEIKRKVIMEIIGGLSEEAISRKIK